MAAIRWTLAATLGFGLLACGTGQGSVGDPVTLETASQVSALEVNEDGSDLAANDAVDEAPTTDPDCSVDGARKRLLATFDTNHDGKLEGSELTALREEFGDGAGRGLHLMRHARREYLRWLYDANHDGRLEPDERAELETDLAARCEAKKQALLTKYDVNHDGKLEAGEWGTFVRDLLTRYRARRVELLAKFDINHDGHLDQGERIAARKALKARFDELRAQLETEYDTNHDGTLDAAEEAALVDALKQRVRDDEPLLKP